MPRFVYKAKKSPKEIIEGKIEAQDAKDAVMKLRQMAIYPIFVESEESLAQSKKGSRFFQFKKGVSLSDISIYTRQLSNLLDSGMTLVNALEVLIQQTQNPLLIEATKDIKADIKDGISFSLALSKHPNIFPHIYTNMVKSGEVGGMLDEVLSRLSDFAEADEQMLSKIRTSLAYPALMAFVGAVTIFILLSFVAPRLITMFSDLGEALPLPTIILMKISSFFAAFWWLVLLAIVLVYTSLIRWLKTREGKKIFDGFKLNSPLLGHFVKVSEFARLNRTLGTLIRNGVPLVEALDVLSKTVDNDIIAEELANARKGIIDGLSLSKSMKRAKVFSPMMVNMISVGEESGSLENALFKIADSYDKEVDRTIKVFTTLLEPSIILALGVVVGFIVIAMLLPIFQINLLVK